MYEIYGYPFGNPDAELLIYRPGNTQALVLSPKLTREVSKGGSLVFTMPQDHPQYSMLQKMSTVVVAKRDGKEIWRGRVLKHEANFYNQRVVYCEGALSYFNDSSITPFNYKGTLRQFLQHIVDAHNDQVKSQMKCFQLGTVTAALGNMQVQFGDADQYGVGEDYGKVWDILDKLVLKVFGGYFYCGFDAATGYNVLNYCDQAYEEKRQTVQKIEYGRNLLNLSETTDATDLYTRIYPIGNKHTVDTSKWYYKLMWWRDPSKDKHEERWGIMETDAATVAQYLPAAGYSYNLQEGWIQNDTAVQKFGIITRIVEFDTDSANDTFAAGVQALQQNYAMKISYVIRAVDLVDAGYDTDRLDFAMYSHVVSAPHSVDAIMLCTKLVEPFDHPDKKEYSFGMTRRTLTDRQAANIGRTNLLEEQAATSANSTEALLKNLNAYKKSNDAAVADAAKTATNFLSFDASSGLIVGHESLPDKKVQITNSGVKVLSGSSMVNITAKSISITDGAGSCSISSGAITFHGIKNQKPIYSWGKLDLFSAATLALDLSSYSAVLITFESKKGSTWFASGGGAGPVSVVLPVNGKTYSMVYPWNTVHRRDVTVKTSGIIFGSGKERTSFYTTGLGTAATFINLESPVKDGWTGNDSVCMPIELYGFM